MRNVMAALLVCLVATWGTVCPAQEKASDQKPLPMVKVGERVFDLGGGKEKRVAWYRVDVDYNEMCSEQKELVRVVKPDGSVTAYRPLNWWDRIVTPEGTVTAYVGHYGRRAIRGFFDDGQTHADWTASGVSFALGDGHPVKPGEGKVRVAHWLFEEKARDDGMMFQENRYYIFCLDRQPVARGKNLGGEPACEMSTEFDHVIAIIEIWPTFDESGHEPSEALHLEPGTLKSFREEGLNGLTKTYELEYGVERGGDGRLSFVNGEGRRAPADAATLQKLLYAMNTAGWVKTEKEHAYKNSPAVSRTFVEWTDRDGKARRAAIGYDQGGWFMTTEGRFYRAYHPYLLYEVGSEIETKLKEGAGGK